MMGLRTQRQCLFQKCIDAASLEEFLSVQVQIADAIRAAERELRSSDGRDDLTFHISRLRLYVDGLVWLVLHPHTIRQMAKNPAPTPRIGDQSNAFDQVIKSANRNLRRYRAPVLICDITNILKIGDLVICVDPDVPMIVECKSRLPRPEHLMQGRMGRQISRAERLMRYLQKGSAKVFGKNTSLYSVECMHRAERNWSVLTEVCQEARVTGLSRRNISEFEVIWAHIPDQAPSIGFDGLENQIGYAYFGTASGLTNMVDGLFPPPSVWPISSDLRFAVLEGHIEVAHLVHARAFEREFSEGEGIEICPNEDFPIRVRIGTNIYPLSRRFIYDVLYGFETINSCLNGLISFARQLQSIKPPHIQDHLQGKPIISHVDSLQEGITLLNSGTDSQNRLISMPSSLLKFLEQERKKRPGHIAIIPRGPYDTPPAYTIVDWQTFEALISMYIKKLSV